MNSGSKKGWFDEGFPIEDMKKSWKGGALGS